MQSAESLGALTRFEVDGQALILLSEDYALLYGSLLLFAILAALMVATRRLDWARVGREA